MAKTYSATDIQVLEGLDAVRMRPGMYIGSTGPRGLHHLIWEIVDNAIDEASNGYATEISVALKKDGSCEVTDNGRGIPVDIHPQLGVSGVEVVYTPVSYTHLRRLWLLLPRRLPRWMQTASRWLSVRFAARPAGTAPRVPSRSTAFNLNLRLML